LHTLHHREAARPQVGQRVVEGADLDVAALAAIHRYRRAIDVGGGVGAKEDDYGGDFFGGPYDAETVELVRSLEAICIRGNAEELDEWGKTLPLSVELDGVTYCHATPTDNNPITTAVTPEP